MKKLLNRSLRVILALDFAVLTAAGMYAPIQAVFVQEIGGDLLDVGIAVSLFAIAAGVTTFFLGVYSDRIKSKRRIVGIGYLVTAIGFLGYLSVDSVWSLFAVQVFIGLAQASYAPAFDAFYTGELRTRSKIAGKWGAWEAINYFAIAAGASLGALIASLWSFDVMFITMATLCALSGALLLLLPRHMFASDL